MDAREVLLQVFGRIREEVVSQQALRDRLQIFKLIAIGLIPTVAWSQEARPGAATLALLLLPVIAVFLDAYIEGKSRAIKQMGYYIRTQIEPLLLSRQDTAAAFGHYAAGFEPYELFLTKPSTRQSWIAGRMPNMFLTWLTFLAALLALCPWSQILGDQVMLSWPWFGAWAVPVVALLVFQFITFRPPAEWLSLVGSGGAPVLVPGRYVGECKECEQALGPVQLDRGSDFPAHGKHPVAWRWKAGP